MHPITLNEGRPGEEIGAMVQGISEHAQKKMGLAPLTSFTFSMRDETNKVVAGVFGQPIYGVVHVNTLWVHESLRGKGVGNQLMEKVEQYARQNSCGFVDLFTMNFEAQGFYEKRGYTVQEVRKGYHKGCEAIYLRKELA